MNQRNTNLVIVISLLASASCMAAQGEPTEAQCRLMVDGMLQSMKSTPLETERDRKGAKEVIDRAEKVVRVNRQRGASECESWAAIGQIVVNQ